MKAIVEKSNEAREIGDWKAIEKAFDGFVKKLEGHTDFEENMLFKFIREKISADADDGSYPVHFADITESHETEFPEMIEKIKAGLKIETTGKAEEASSAAEKEKNSGNVPELMQSFYDLLLRHLEEEERALVAPWLNWTSAQYKSYRSYLSWKYSAMY